MKTKTFDCVEMMHKGARRIYESTRGMSRKAELAYWQGRSKGTLPAAQAQPQGVGIVRENRPAYRVSR